MLPSYLQFTPKCYANLTIFSVRWCVKYLGSLAATLCAPHFSEVTWLFLLPRSRLTTPSKTPPAPISLLFRERLLLERKISATSNCCYGNLRAEKNRVHLTWGWISMAELLLWGSILLWWWVNRVRELRGWPNLRATGKVLAWFPPDSWLPHFTEGLKISPKINYS